jgi:hypothetical protein
MKRGDLVKHYNAPWFGIITRVKRFNDPPPGIQHVELVWLTSDVNAVAKDKIASSLLLMVSEA